LLACCVVVLSEGRYREKASSKRWRWYPLGVLPPILTLSEMMPNLPSMRDKLVFVIGFPFFQSHQGRSSSFNKAFSRSSVESRSSAAFSKRLVNSVTSMPPGH